jgi:hypothetical protein
VLFPDKKVKAPVGPQLYAEIILAKGKVLPKNRKSGKQKKTQKQSRAFGYTFCFHTLIIG